MGRGDIWLGQPSQALLYLIPPTYTSLIATLRPLFQAFRATLCVRPFIHADFILSKSDLIDMLA